MKNYKNNVSKEELIRLLKLQDEEIREYEKIENEKSIHAQNTEIELLRKQKEIENQQRLERQINEQKNINYLQKVASEASIKKGEIEKAQSEIETIDRELLELLSNSRRRVTKLASKFIDLSREKTNLLTKNQIESRNNISEDIKSVSRHYEDSILRNEKIINEEIAKEKETQRNITLLTKTIDLTVLKKENKDISDELSSLSHDPIDNLDDLVDHEDK